MKHFVSSIQENMHGLLEQAERVAETAVLTLWMHTGGLSEIRARELLKTPAPQEPRAKTRGRAAEPMDGVA
jgi:hypothetical protein